MVTVIRRADLSEGSGQLSEGSGQQSGLDRAGGSLAVFVPDHLFPDSGDVGMRDALGRLADLLRDALAAGDSQKALVMALSILGVGVTLIDFYDRLLAPVMVTVGQAWRRGILSVAQEHIYSTTVRTLIDRLGGLPTPPLTRGRIVLVPGPGEQHIIGLMMLRHTLRAHGWRVSMPDPLSGHHLAEYAATLADVRMLGVSVHEGARPTVLREWISDCRQSLPGLPVVLGGQALAADPDLWRRVGANGGAFDLPGSVALIDGLTNPLTPKERQILRMAGDGRTNEEIARRLAVKLSTVKTHLERIYLKLDARDRASCVATALRRQLIE
jgi:DNA-binding CsgD family transcriptional regulator/methylmalonyl-CoA mutase cobalamin-binding subunit